jgi:acyl-coenzyme A thioesterase PaaI-like protein
MPATTEDSGKSKIPLSHSKCLICGNSNPVSLRLSFQLDVNGGVCARFTANERLQGYDGLLHGGVTASLLDAAMTHCLFHNGVEALTGDLHVRYLQPIHCTTVLEIRAWILSRRRPLFELKGEIRVENQLMAWAEAKFMKKMA